MNEKENLLSVQSQIIDNYIKRVREIISNKKKEK